MYDIKSTSQNAPSRVPITPPLGPLEFTQNALWYARAHPTLLYTTIYPSYIYLSYPHPMRPNSVFPSLPCRRRTPPLRRPRLHITRRWGHLRDPDPLGPHERLKRAVRRHDALEPLLQHRHQTRVDDRVARRVRRGAHEIARVGVLVHVCHKRRVHGREAALREEFEQRCVDGVGGGGGAGAGIGGCVGVLEGAGVGGDA